MTGSDERHDVTTRAGFAAFYDHAFTAVYRSAAVLTRGDRPAAEDLVQSAFVRLVQAVHAGQVDSVGVGWVVTPDSVAVSTVTFLADDDSIVAVTDAPSFPTGLGGGIDRVLTQRPR